MAKYYVTIDKKEKSIFYLTPLPHFVAKFGLTQIKMQARSNEDRAFWVDRLNLVAAQSYESENSNCLMEGDIA